MGITLVETMVTVAIIAILAAVALPNLSDYFTNQRIKNAAENTYVALQNAKFESAKINQVISLAIQPDSANASLTTWCFGRTVAPATTCDCTGGTPSCADGSVVSSTDYPNVTLTFNNNNLRSFSPLRGSADGTQGTLTFTNGTKSLGVKLSTYGRVTICRPSGTSITGYTDSDDC